MVYVIGDIHGCFDEFQKMLGVIKFNPESDKMYFVGDYIDKGKDSYKMLLTQAYAELRAFKRKYHMLKELQEIFDMIQ